ncbi:YdcF family protein [Glaciecola siphonariae]|uniref:YdcF family protein n=1 Tax=Glaciecola siphonariae TaxID=521012 RepID=A0ABV9LXF5_9ALTE
MSGAWLYLCSQYFFSYWLLSPLETHSKHIDIYQESSFDNSAIFVFACYFYDADNMPDVDQWNDCSLRRLTHASLMYKASKQSIILTGGDFNEYSDASYSLAARDFLVRMGVDENDILVVDAGTNSSEEVQALKNQQASFSHYHVITSATHAYRVDTLFARYNFSSYCVHPVDHYNVNEFNFDPSLPSIANLERTRAAFYEYAAIINMYFQD